MYCDQRVTLSEKQYSKLHSNSSALRSAALAVSEPRTTTTTAVATTVTNKSEKAVRPEEYEDAAESLLDEVEIMKYGCLFICQSETDVLILVYFFV